MGYPIEIAKEEKEKRIIASREHLEEANRRVFERECLRDGVDPKLGCSPALLKTLGGRR